MKKRIISLLVCLVIILVSLPLSSLAATVRSISFFVNASTTGKLSSKIDVISVSSLTANTTYRANIDLPIGAIASELKLSWTSSNISSVKKGSSTQNSGRVAIAAAGNSLTLYVYLTSTTKATFIFTTNQQEINIVDPGFFIAADSEAGLMKEFKATTSSTGTNAFDVNFKYMPGGDSVDYSKLMLSWANTDKITLMDSAGNICESGKTPLVTGATYSATFYSDDKQTSVTEKFTVKLMRGSDSVEMMFLDIDESRGKISAMNADNSHETICYGTVTFLGETNYMSIKGRGNHTWRDCTKKPYNITVFKDEECTDKKKVEYIPGVKSKKWSILANASDGSLLRNKIGYDLALKMGIGLDSRFIDIWMNGDFIGNYLLTPKNDYQTTDDGFLVELDNKTESGVGADPQFSLDKITSYGDSANKFTVKDFGDDAIQAAIDKGYTYTVDPTTGKVIKDETYLMIRDWMQEAIYAVTDFDTEDYLNYFDIDSWAKMYIMHELEKNYDVISGSIFMHRDGLEEDDMLIAGPVWDVDNAFGRSNQSMYSKNCGYSGISNTIQHSAEDWYINAITNQTSLLQYLGKHESFMKRVYQIYNEYKDDINALPNNVDVLSASIRASAEMNYDRWGMPNINKYNTTCFSSTVTLGTGDYTFTQKKTSTFDDFLYNLKEYLRARTLFFSKNLTVDAPVCTVEGETKYSVGETITLTATPGFDGYKWQISKKGKNWDDIEGANSNVYTAAATEDLDSYYIRCVVTKNGKKITTSNVASTYTSANTYAQLSNTLHIHIYDETVVLPTDTEDGYIGKLCSCGEIIDKSTLEKIVYGDANLDGYIDVCDCVYIISVLPENMGYRNIAAADVNKDSSVDSVDANLIAKFVARLILSF